MAVSSTLKIGVAQISAELHDLPANLDKHRAYIAQAREQGVELLLFPELSLTGYQVGLKAVDLAMEKHDPHLLALAEEAGEMTVAVGFVEEGFAAQFYNSCALLRRGRLDFIHRKINLATYNDLEEDKYFAEGRYVEVAPLEVPWTAGITICADMWNPGLVHMAALHGATVLLGPVASGLDVMGEQFSNPEGWAMTVKFYASVYGMPVVMANHCGTEANVRFWGGSRIVDPFGQVLAEADDTEQLIVADLDYNDVRRARFQLPTVRDSNLDLMAREVDRLVNRVGVPVGLRRY